MNDESEHRLLIKIEEIRASREISRPLLQIHFGGHYYKETKLIQIPSSATICRSHPQSTCSSPREFSMLFPLSLVDLYSSELEYIPEYLSFSYAWCRIIEEKRANTRNPMSLKYLYPSSIMSHMSSLVFGKTASASEIFYSGSSFSFPTSDHGLLFDTISILLYEQSLISGCRLIGSLIITSPQEYLPFRWINFEPRSNTTSSTSILLSISIINKEFENTPNRNTILFSPRRSIASMNVPIWMRPLLSFLDEETVNLGVSTLLHLLTSFGQGLEGYSHSSLLGALIILSRFESWKRSRGLYFLTSIYRSKHFIKDQTFVDKARHYFRFAISAYGWKGLTLLGRRSLQNFFSNPSSEKVAILSYLNIKECDLLHITESNGLFQPHCVIFYDSRSSDHPSIVIALRGSLSIYDWMTSFGGHYTSWNGGFVHSGISKAANYVKKNIFPLAISYARQLGISKISIVGHSLGGATAFLALLFLYFDENADSEHDTNGVEQSTTDFEGISIDAYSYGSPPVVSLELLPLFDGLSTYSFVFGNDIVPHMSCGSLIDYRALIERATAHVTIRNILNPIFDNISPGTSPDNSSLMMFRILLAVEQQSVIGSPYPKLYVPGKLYYIYDVENGFPVDMPTVPTSSPVMRSMNNPDEFHKFTAISPCDPLLFGQFFIQPYMVAHHSPIAYDDALYHASQSILRGAFSSSNDCK